MPVNSISHRPLPEQQGQRLTEGLVVCRLSGHDMSQIILGTDNFCNLDELQQYKSVTSESWHMFLSVTEK